LIFEIHLGEPVHRLGFPGLFTRSVSAFYKHLALGNDYYIWLMFGFRWALPTRKILKCFQKENRIAIQ